jgi:iron complex outermembrane receptor protein
MKRVLLATAVSAQALTGAAFAQEDDTARRLDTVLITSAPGPDRASDELIGNATALDRAELIADLSGTLGDTLDRQPGVASSFFGTGASRPILRGLGAERVLVLTNGIGVIDVSAASPDHQVTADGIDADKIEILRGPAALAYGGQAIGGVVNVVDGLISETLPDEPVSGEIFGAYNSDTDGLEGAGRVRYTTGPFVLAATASARDFDDYSIPGFSRSAALRADDPLPVDEEASDTQPNSFVETGTVAGGLSWIGENAFLGAAVRNQTAKYGLPTETGPFIDMDQTRYDIRGGLHVNNGFLTDMIGTASFADYTHTEFEEAGVPGTVFNSDGAEARLEADHQIGEIKGSFGIQYYDKSVEAIGDESFLTPTDSTSTGVFLYETREWESGASLEGGLRYDAVELDNANAGTRSFDLVSGSLGIHRHYTSGWFAGLQVSYSERAPNESELFAFGPHFATNQFEVGDANLGKESGLNTEATLRWSGNAATIGFNAFVTKFSDFIYLTPSQIIDGGVPVSEVDGIDVFAFAQDDATFTGGELYGNYNVPSGWLSADWAFDGSIDLVKAELDSGGNVPLIPPVTVNAGVTANWARLELGGTATWAGDQKDPGTGEQPTDSYTLFGLRGAYDLSGYGLGRDGTQVFLEVRNLTDEEARVSTSVLKDELPLPGRNVRAGIRLTF